MRIAVYTSCALNYYAKARALADSIRRNSPGTSVTLCLGDEMWPDFDPLAEGFDRFWTPRDLGFDAGWIFKHNVMELCTAIKGRALLRLMREEPDADLYVYLDPDVYVYNALSQVETCLEGASIGLVPHILSVEETDIGVQMTEMSVIEHGIYNLGHLFVRGDENGRALAEWWAARLDAYCYDDKTVGLFTDQRWMDLAPAVFDGVRILRVPNLDVASWNLFGREIRQQTAGDERGFTVDGHPLITYHFSGTGPTGTHRRVREIFDPSNGAMAEIERLYEAAIAEHGQARLEKVPPFYDCFDDGTPIRAEMRKLYRVHPDLQRAFPDPYAAGPGRSYLGWLRENHPALAGAVAIATARLERAFDDLFDAGFYLDRYPDAAQAIAQGQAADALDHYIRIGSALLYDPNEFFVARYYFERAKYLDGFTRRRLPRSKRTTLLWHYLETGLPNGVEPVEFFDSRHYLEQNADVAQAFRIGGILSPLAHFLHFGSVENRRPGPDFNPADYIGANPEVTGMIERENLRGGFGAFVRQGGVLGRTGAPADA